MTLYPPGVSGSSPLVLRQLAENMNGTGSFGTGVFPVAALPTFGAVGNGVADDTAVVKTALQSGYVIDGLNKTYGITGQCQPTSFKGLVNAKLIQLAPTASATTRTLHINTKSDWMIDNVEIDCGSTTNYPAVGDISGSYCGFRATTCNRFSVRGLTVKNGGPFNGIHFSTCTEFTASDCKVKDFTYNLAVDPSDEVIQGIYVQLCDNFSIINCRVKNLTGFLSGVASQQRSRGIAFAGNSNGRVIGNHIENVDEAFDFTGTDGSNHILLDGNFVYNVASYGYKFTGGAVNNLCTNNIARKCGLVSFICVGGSGAGGQPASHGMIFRNCHSYDVGGNTIPAYVAQRYGFRVSQGSAVTTEQYSVMIDDCSAVDDQLVPTMDGGAFTDVVPTAGVARNVLKNFVSRGHISFATSGFSLASPRVVHTGFRAPASGTDGTDITPANTTTTWIAEIYVPESMQVTGIAYLKGSAIANNVQLALADANGFTVASTASTAMAATANIYQRVAFTTGYYAVQGTYFIKLQVSNVAVRFRAHAFGNFATGTQTGGVFGTFVDATGPTTFAADVGPIASLY